MNLHLEELNRAQVYARTTRLQGLTSEQFSLILCRGRALHSWFKAHQRIHFLINLSVIAFIFCADYCVLLWLPRLFLIAGGKNSLVHVVLAALAAGIVHSWLLYSMVVFSLHEGAAHRLIFPPKGPITKFFNALANNLCRFGSADPVFYTKHHLSHHAHFGTEEDGEFLNFVFRRRYWMTFFPFAMFINTSDFIVHRATSYSVSLIVSMLASVSYHGLLGYFMARSFGLPFTLLTLILVVPHVGFYVDRLRQFTEHNQMPLDNKDGARNFGLGFWGLFIGGGPWGQPCHWAHHLVPSIPWYQQLILHRDVVRLLSPEQRDQHLLQPFVGFPKLVWRLWRMPHSLALEDHRSSSK